MSVEWAIKELADLITATNENQNDHAQVTLDLSIVMSDLALRVAALEETP